MPTIRFDNSEINCPPGATLLAACEQAGVTIPYSCRNGACLTCMLRVTKGEVRLDWQAGIRPTLAAQGHVLACRCTPDADLSVVLPEDSHLFGRAMIAAIERPTENIARVRLRPANDMFFHGGQFINVRRADGLVRSYSIASVPRIDTMLEIHVKRLPGGAMSNWFCDAARPGMAVDIQGPNGDCYYLPGDKDRPLMLVGNGTGVAPLAAIARDALLDGHAAPVHLYHGSRHPPGLYLDTELRALAGDHANFVYHPCLSGWPGGNLPDWAPTGCGAGRAEDIAFADHTDLKGWRVFLCGYPPMVHASRKRAYLAGAAMDDILSDAFELRDLRSEPRD